MSVSFETKNYDLNNHIRELIKEIVVSHKTEGYDQFEKISMLTREMNTKLNFQYKTTPQTVKPITNLTDKERQVLNTHLTHNPKKAHLTDHYMEDLFSFARIFEWGGVSFSDDEWYKIQLAMKKILISNNCSYLRFFGKIFGTKSDYYILQGIQKQYPMQNPPVHVETRGNEGINRYTFWVSNSILESWHELPDITHEQLQASRLFKYHLTGDLNAKVKAFRPFPGKEMHLLKCQIVRILHSSNIVPSGYLKTSENFKDQLEGKVTEVSDEYTPPSFDEIKAPEVDKWIHEEAYIFPNGKVIDPSIENQVERMKSISEDEGYKVKEGEGENANEVDKKYWKVKVVGDQMVHNRAEGEPIIHAIVLIRNMRWPGTLTVWKEGKFANIYVGFGIKATDSPYSPTQLKRIDNDPEDANEQREPNPEKEPPKPEEVKEGEEGEEGEQKEEEE